MRKIWMLIVMMTMLAATGCRSMTPYYPGEKCPETRDPNCVQLCPTPGPCSLCHRQLLVDYLKLHNVQVVRVGEEMRILIPVDNLYHPHSANFVHEYLPVIDAVARFLHCFAKVDVKVAGYTDCGGDPHRNLMLSQLQAEKLIKYLWREGVDTRILHSKGYGKEHNIARNCSFYGKARNRRIEITFRDLGRISYKVKQSDDASRGRTLNSI